MQNNPITETPIWKQLQTHCTDMQSVHMNDLFKNDTNRFETLHQQNNSILFDYSKHNITPQTVDLLCELATKANLEEFITGMQNGDILNTTENRSVMHMALRSGSSDPDIDKFATKSLQYIQNLSQKIRDNKAITDIINIGIGGSDLGPKMITTALSDYADGPNIHYLSNIDGHAINALLKTLSPKNTAIIIVSKGFATTETITNAHIIRKWAPNAPCYAVTENTQAAQAFGIEIDNILPLKDWIGGRFSLWSAAGLSIAVSIGFENFKSLLDGAKQADTHFTTTPFHQNIPVIMALLSIWYHNFMDYRAHAISPYTESMRYFVPYIQQTDMESNGKSVCKNGEDINRYTGPLILGGTGTSAQHAYFQHFHQSKTITPIDFIISAKPAKGHEDLHTLLNANALAQSKALMEGRENKEEPHRHFTGNRPSSTFMLDEISPYTLGMLTAFYEHKIVVHGAILNINSFDQWGVELGKSLTHDILDVFENNKSHENIDTSTRGLINHLKNR